MRMAKWTRAAARATGSGKARRSKETKATVKTTMKTSTDSASSS